MTTEAKIVIGANYGDEGKGAITDFLASKAIQKEKSTIVVCTNGGAQRGHTVELDDGRRHVFHHFGSGSFAGAETYLPDHFILNPLVFNQEYDELIGKGVTPVCTVHPDCMVSTPFDMILNQIIEESREENRHGSCGLGIWETIVRSKHMKTTLDHLMRLDAKNKLEDYLANIRDKYFDKRLSHEHAKRLSDPRFESKIYQKWNSIIYSDNLIKNWITDFKSMVFRIHDITKEKYIFFFDCVIFENGQGLRLDEHFGDHSTPSKTGLDFPREILYRVFGSKLKYIDLEIIYVTRPYLTRHGADKNFVENLTIQKRFHDKTNLYNPHQGLLKYAKFPDSFSVFNTIGADTDRFLSAYGEASYIDFKQYKIGLAVTHCDHLQKNVFSESQNGLPNDLYHNEYYPVEYSSNGPKRSNICYGSINLFFKEKDISETIYEGIQKRLEEGD